MTPLRHSTKHRKSIALSLPSKKGNQLAKKVSITERKSHRPPSFNSLPNNLNNWRATKVSKFNDYKVRSSSRMYRRESTIKPPPGLPERASGRNPRRQPSATATPSRIWHTMAWRMNQSHRIKTTLLSLWICQIRTWAINSMGGRRSYHWTRALSWGHRGPRSVGYKSRSRASGETWKRMARKKRCQLE